MGEAKYRRAEIEQLKRNDPWRDFTVLNSSFRDQKLRPKVETGRFASMQEDQKQIRELAAEIATLKHASRRKAA